MLSQARKPEDRHRESKGAEIETMPYFLTSEYKAIVDANAKSHETIAGGKENTAATTGTYKSQWLKDKLAQQNEKRKVDRKKGSTAATGEKAVGKKKQIGESEEMLMEIIEELRADLKLRDNEFEQQRERLQFLEKQNKELAVRTLKERQDKMTVEAKLNKIITLKELDSNFAAIEGNTFFD